MPLAGGFAATEDDARNAPRYPVTWLQCRACTAVQVLEDVPDEVLFSNYNYASSMVEGLVRHFEAFATVLKARHGPHPLAFLEIGCNDGVLLRKLPANWRLIGVDPSDVALCASAGDARYALHNAPFSRRLVTEQGLAGSVDVVSGSNCLAHISNIRETFEAAHLALRPGGVFWIEVHDLDELVRTRQWDTIYHEHRLEWSWRSLQNCLAPIGFELLEHGRQPLHGGLLRCCFRKTDRRLPGSQAGNLAGAPEAEGLAALRDAYLRRYDTPAAVNLRQALGRGEPIAAYGAAGRANVYLNQLRELRFAYVVDESPLRIGRYIPGAAVRVVPRDVFQAEPTRWCLITAWNYGADIVRKNPSYRGTWLTAFGDD